MDNRKSIFQTLSAVNVNSFTEKKNNLTYLSWSHAWNETVKLYPDATYEVVSFPHADGTVKPYVYDADLGYLVQTVVRIEDLTIPMQLPVIDGANKAMKKEPYTYKGTAWVNGTKTTVDKTVDAATMFDINTAIMRCLTKNLALFGLGLYIYSGEDVPQQLEEQKETAKTTSKTTAKPAPVKQEQTKDDAELEKRKEAALKAFNALKKEPEIIKHLIQVEKLTKYASVADFVKGEDIEKVLEVYNKIIKLK